MTDHPERTTESIHHLAALLDDASMLDWFSAMHADAFRAFEAVTPALPVIATLAETVADVLQAGGRVVFAGAGTSGRLGALEAAECPPTFASDPDTIVALMAGGPGALTTAIEGAEDDERAGASAIANAQVGAGDVVIGLSASGSTPWVRGVLRAARETGATTGAIVCNPHTPIAALADIDVVLATGAEFLAGSTRLKAATAQKLALNLITTGAMRSLGRVRSGQMVALRATNAKLRDRALRIVRDITGLDEQRASELLNAANGDVALALARIAAQSRRPASASTDPVTIRQLSDDDLTSIVRLATLPSVVDGTAAFVATYGDSLFAEWIRRPGCMLGAFRDDTLLGVVLAETPRTFLREHVLDIGYVAVDQEERGKGVGDALLSATLAWAREAGFSRVELRVWPENVAAIRLYERHGLRIEGRLHQHAIVDGQPRDAYVMARVGAISS
jgi:N-acetylmuramic acid 6-phosphate etherase